MIKSQINEESNESGSIVLHHKAKCPLHSLTIKLFCIICSQKLCLRCLIEHTADKNHKYKDYSYPSLKKISSFSQSQSKNLTKQPETFPFSLKTSLKEEFLEHGVKIISEIKAKLYETLEKYCDDLISSYKQTVFKSENKADFLMSMSNRKLTDELANNGNPNHKETRKIMINHEKIEEFELFLRNCLFISQENAILSSQKNQNYPKIKPRIKIKAWKSLEKRQNPCYLHALLPKFNSLFLFDINTESSLYVSIKKSQNFVIPSNPSTFQVSPENLIVFSGHFDNVLSDISLETYFISMKTFEMRLLEGSRTNYAKIANGIALLDKFVYSIGGKLDLNKRTSFCERFSLETRKWEKIPNLNYLRSSPSAMVFDNKEIYVFFGLDEKNQACTKIEKFTTFDREWIEIKFSGFLENSMLFQVSCLQINEEEILCFGGYQNNDHKRGENAEILGGYQNCTDDLGGCQNCTEIFQGYQNGTTEILTGYQNNDKKRRENTEIWVLNISKKEGVQTFKPHPMIQGSSQICNAMINEKNEIMSLRYVNNEVGEKIGEFEEIFSICAINEKESRVVEIVNCRLLEKIIKK